MKTKQILIFLFLTLNLTSVGQSSNKVIQVDKRIKEKNYDSIIDAKININIKPIRDSITSQVGTIKLLKTEIEKYELKESLFSNQLSILTAIFSAIVAIAIFIIGYLVPKLTENKHEEELTKLKSAFKKVVDEIKTTKEETKELGNKHDYFNAKLTFFSCYDSKFSIATLLWALRYSRYYFIYTGKDAKKDEVTYYINCAQDQLAEIEAQTDHDLKIYLEEFNEIIAELKPKVIEADQKTLENIHQKFNEACWKKKVEEK